MQAVLLMMVLAAPGQGEPCPNGGAFGTYRSAPAAVRCPQYTPPVRWYCKPCAGCAGGTCLSCQQPYLGSAPYNYRVTFDYPWSQQPAFPFGNFEPSTPGDVEEIIDDPEITGPEQIGPSARKAGKSVRR